MITEAKIRQILAQILRSDAPLKWDINYIFVGDALDSLDYAAFLLAIQDQLGVVVPDDDMPQLNCIAATLTYLRARSASASA